MPVCYSYISEGHGSKMDDRLLTMRNQKIDLWEMSSGKLLNTVNLDLEDWSTRNYGDTIEKRHMSSLYNYVAYAGYHSHKYSWFSVDSKKMEMHTKEVFKPFSWNRNSPTPDFCTESIDHVATLSLIDSINDEETCNVVLCNGRTRDIIIIGKSIEYVLIIQVYTSSSNPLQTCSILTLINYQFYINSRSL